MVQTLRRGVSLNKTHSPEVAVLNARYFFAPLLVLCAWLFCVGAVVSMFQDVHSNVESTLARSSPPSSRPADRMAQLVSVGP